MNWLRFVVTSVLLILASATALAAFPSVENDPQPTPAIEEPAPTLALRYTTLSHTVADGETASGILRKLGASKMLAGAGRGLDRLGIGDTIHVDRRSGEREPWRLRFDKGEGTALVITEINGRFVAQRQPVPYQIERGRFDLTVETSLWAAATSAGVSGNQIMGIAKIFEYDLDFNTELVKGATIRLAATRLTDESGDSRMGTIRGALLRNGKDEYVAIRYHDSSGNAGWYTPDGFGRKKAFLRSPLEFSRVTSGFSRGRFHPILKSTRAHLGVDFGAPTGTPVRAVADGVVDTAGRNGGHGNYIEVDHEGPYSTSYSHLSRIVVKRGQKVRQGDVIGHVGSTGMSTGPHLHYQFMVNGKYQDPMTTKLPMTTTVSAIDEAAFKALAAEMVKELKG